MFLRPRRLASTLGLLALLVLSALVVPPDAHAQSIPTFWSDGCSGTTIGAWSPDSIYDDFDPAVSYSAGWHGGPTGGPDYMGTRHSTHTTGAAATFTTPNMDLTWFAVGYVKTSNSGRAAVYIDGVYVYTINMYAPTRSYYCEALFLGPTHGRHTVTVKSLGTKGSGSSDTFVNVDYFVAAF